jgi:hypothetical protein
MFGRRNASLALKASIVFTLITRALPASVVTDHLEKSEYDLGRNLKCGFPPTDNSCSDIETPKGVVNSDNFPFSPNLDKNEHEETYDHSSVPFFGSFSELNEPRHLIYQYSAHDKVGPSQPISAGNSKAVILKPRTTVTSRAVLYPKRFQPTTPWYLPISKGATIHADLSSSQTLARNKYQETSLPRTRDEGDDDILSYVGDFLRFGIDDESSQATDTMSHKDSQNSTASDTESIKSDDQNAEGEELTQFKIEDFAYDEFPEFGIHWKQVSSHHSHPNCARNDDDMHFGEPLLFQGPSLFSSSDIVCPSNRNSQASDTNGEGSKSEDNATRLYKCFLPCF